MRSDMAKVIVERPRLGSRLPSRKKGYRKYLQKLGVEELPSHEPLPGRWHGRQRHLNEHLGPMRRFLRSNVGRPWNKVHQELCEHVNFDNAVQKHVLTHVFDFVHQHVCVHARRVYGYRRWGCLQPFLLATGEMYVCPDSGLLKVVKPSRRQLPPRRIPCGPLLQHIWRHNAWWEVRLRKIESNTLEMWDVWLEKPVGQISKQESARAYGGHLFAISQRPLTVAETRAFWARLRKSKNN